MNSRERLLTAIDGGKPDHVPLLCWCFGWEPPAHLRWRASDPTLTSEAVRHWYTLRLEHIHTLPQPWTLEDEFCRVERWLSLGLDDVIEVSPPWGIDPQVRVRDWQETSTTGARSETLLGRTYETPAGELRHVVRRTHEEVPRGWVLQPDHVPLFEDMNIPRGVEHAVSGADDLHKLRFLLQDASPTEQAAYAQRMTRIKRFAADKGVLVQAWSAFGLDAVVWLCGVEGAIMLAMTEPEVMQELVDIVYAFDRRRTEWALGLGYDAVGGVDLIVQRGWYSSTEFWSPQLFRRFVLPHLRELADLVHGAGARLAYTMTTGVAALAELLIEAGVDLLYYIDPVQDDLDLAAFRAAIGAGRLAVAGGVNTSVTLNSGTDDEIRQAVHEVVRIMAPDGGFILAPVDALFPDTPWRSVEAMIAAWREVSE